MQRGAFFSFLAARFWLWAAVWFERRELTTLVSFCYREASKGKTTASAQAAHRHALGLFTEEKYAAAAEICRQSLKKNPQDARLWCLLGAAERALANMPQARAAYEKALHYAPRYAPALSNLGEWLLLNGDNQAALARLDQALAVDPRLKEALNNRIAALYELGEFAAAEKAAEDAIAFYPDEAALHCNLGNVLLHSGKARQAVDAFKKALSLDPSSPEAQIGLSTLLGESHRLSAARQFFEQEIALKGANAQRLASLAMAQRAQEDWQAAEKTCHRVLKIQPGNIPALTTLAACYSARADHEKAIELHRRALASNRNMPAIHSNISFDATYLPDVTPEQVFACHAEWAELNEKPLLSERAPLFVAAGKERDPERPLRIGYVSGDFSTHPVGFLLRDVISHHQQCEIYCYAMTRHTDSIGQAIKDHATAWVDALFMSDDDLAERIRDDQIDILVDLSGHTAYNRLPVFVRRPAPVQASWIGYFHSTGLNSIDYFITDSHTSPRGCEQRFSETPLWLPHSRFCYAPPDYAPPPADLKAKSAGYVTFGSFNRVEKLVKPVIAAWAEILRQTPDSRLVIKSGALRDPNLHRYFARRFRAHGIAEDRLDLRGPSPHPQMLAEYGDIDIALDPFPFNGGMTTIEALWMGVPVVSVAGQGVVSRQTHSALANIGLDGELVFPDLAAYIAGAVSLANDLPRLEELRQSLRDKMAASPICQPAQFTRDLEDLYRQMWRAWCKGERLPSAIAG